jgi:hypothetical protein
MVRVVRAARFDTLNGPEAQQSRIAMRKKTEPPTTEPSTASSCVESGLIAKRKRSRQSVGRKSTVDNRSHRTNQGSRRAVEAR